MTPGQKAERWRQLRCYLSNYRHARKAVVKFALQGKVVPDYEEASLRTAAVDLAECIDRLDGSAP